jgi:hypothetical protein
MLFCTLSFMAQANEVKVPEAIMTKLNSMYPQADQIDWRKEGEEYQADFVYHDKCISVLFKKDAEIIYQREEITKAEVPAVIMDAMNKKYLDKGYKLSYVMTRWAKNDYSGKKLYEIEVLKGRLLYMCRFDDTGKEVSKFKMDKLDMTSSPIVP